MSPYLKPILRFGLISPCLFQGVLLAMVAFGISKLDSTRKVKQERYREELQRQAAIKAIESQIAPKRREFAEQKTLLQSDSMQIFTRTLDLILPKYKNIELERMGMVFLLENGRINRAMQVEAKRVKSGFEGGLGPMQEALLQVESLMPHAVLEELRISRKTDLLADRREKPAFDATHTCWRAGESKP